MSKKVERGRAEDPASGESQNEPELRGTLLFTTVLLVLIFGFWAMMYLTLLDR